MRNFINISFKEIIVSTMALFLLMVTNTKLQAQNPDANAVANQTVFCEGLGEMLQLQETATSNLMYSWTGPNGWTSNIQNPTLEITTIAQSGNYCVVVTDAFGRMSDESCVTVSVSELVSMTCPNSITVTPNLDPNAGDCALDLVDFRFNVNQINCGADLEYSITLLSSNGIETPESGLENGIMTSGSGTYPTPGLTYEDLPFGTHELTISFLDRNNNFANVGECVIDVRVIESINNVACNDQINLTLDNNCEGIVTQEMILQGDYCPNSFTMAIPGVDTITGMPIMINAPGLYTVHMTGPSGLSCWGHILAEDKSLPILDCDDVEVFCSETESIAPGSSIRGFDRFVLTNYSVGSGTTDMIPLPLIDIFGNINNVVLNFEAQIRDVSNLELSLTSPAGTTINLLDLGSFTSNCTGNNINICLTDDAINTHSDFGSPIFCRETQNALIGSYQPLQALRGFNNELAFDNFTNIWMLNVTNNGNTAFTIVEADLQVYTTEGTFLGSNDIILSNGCSDNASFTWEDVETGSNCENGYWTTFERTWTVTNENSGLSNTCTQTINVKRWSVDDIIWPKSYDDLDQPSFNCDDVAGNLDANNVVLPSFSGTPGVPYGEICDNFQITHNDLTFNICGDVSKKTIRTWAVLDWCTGDIVQHEQVIKVVDEQPIVFSCVPDNLSQTDADAIGYDMTTESYIVTTYPYTCEGEWEIVYPLVFDNACDDALTIEVFYLLDDDDNPDDAPLTGNYIQTEIYDVNGNQINASNSNGVAHTIRNLPSGRRTWIRMIATDDCGNTGECFTEVDVVDNVRPNPVCIEFTVVALGENGCGILPAESLDNGSWDNCAVDTFLVSRSATSGFSSELEFCCSCNLTDQTVYLRVTDEAGNSNTCEVRVELQDNLPPLQVSTPEALFTYDCSQSPVDINSILDQSRNEFAWIDNCNYANGGDGSINLRVTIVNESDARRPFESTGCGSGSRSVRYEVRDDCGDLLTTFNQTFRFENSSISNPNSFQVLAWPVDATLNDCANMDGLNPENLASNQNANAIRVNTSSCNDIAIGWDDVTFTDVEDACLKILRTWTVIDWCIADQTSLAQGTRSHTQVIRIDDTVAPSIDAPGTLIIDSDSDNCSTFIDSSALVAIVTDDCTDMFANQELITWHSIAFADGQVKNPTDGTDATGAYPFGTSVISWYAEDHCGNVFETTTNVIVRDTKAPTPYCLGTVVTATMSNNGTASIWASDFDLGGTDNYTGNISCGNTNDLLVYFLDGNTQVQSLTFDCDDIPNGISQTIALEVYYQDEAGNTDFCIVQLFLQDNQSDLCPDVVGSRIDGTVQTEFNEMISGVTVSIDNYATEWSTFDMTSNGEYAFNDVATNNNYSINAELDTDDVLNGVSTLDLVLIQRHILGLQSLDSPFKVIAADADNSGSISTIDLLTIRKLILGIIEEYPNNQTAWRMPEKNQAFPNPTVPFPYNETIEIFNLQNDMSNMDFVAVKVGDVNGSVDLSNFGGSEPIEKRAGKDLTLNVEDRALTAGSTITIPVFANDDNTIVGLQQTLNFDTNVLEFVSINAGAINLREENTALYNASNGSIALSWNTLEGLEINNDTPLYELTFNVINNDALSNVLYSSSSMLKSEAYNSKLESLDIEIAYRGVESMVLYQNVPNPFLETTEIRFALPENSNVVFTVFDVNGREIYREQGQYNSGMHSINLTREQLSSTGVMYYKLDTDFGSESKKMIQIR